MNPWAAVLLIVFGSYRLTRLVTADSLTAAWRRRWFHRFPPESHLAGRLIECPFCAGVWVSAATLAVAHAVGLAGWPLRWEAVVLPAVAGAQGLLSALDEKLGFG